MLIMLSYIWLPILVAIISVLIVYSVSSDSRIAKILRFIIWISILIFGFIILGDIGHEIWMGR